MIDTKNPVETMEQLLDQVEDERLYSILSTLDKLTLQILLYKTEGVSDQKIGKVTGIRSGKITTIFYGLRKKLKNF